MLAAALQAIGQTVTGLASYYGHAHQGKTMADGKPFRQEDMTAASRSLPFGTRVKVTSLRNKKSVIVTITDRGPWKKGRIIDLSSAAARMLGMLARGTDRVTVEVLP